MTTGDDKEKTKSKTSPSHPADCMFTRLRDIPVSLRARFFKTDRANRGLYVVFEL